MSGPNPKNLLIVDDDRPFGTMLGWAFEDLGYTVVLAGSCREAIDRLNDCRFECALLDYGLPDGNGQVLAKQMAAEKPGLVIVMMSADRDGALANVGCAPQARALLQKPFSLASVDRLFRAGPDAERSAAQC